MARYNEKNLSKQRQDEIWEEFCAMVARLGTKDDVRRFFCDLLNRQERIMLARRLHIAALLEAGYSYEEIEKMLRTGKHTIARVQRWLSFGREGYKRAIRALTVRESNAATERMRNYYRD